MPYTRAELLAAVKREHPEVAHLDDISLFKAIAMEHPELAQHVQEAPYQSPKWEGQGGPLREGLRAASEGAEHVLEGVPKAITGIPEALMSAPGLALAMAKLHFGMASPEDIQTVVGAVKGVAAPVIPIAKTGIAAAKGDLGQAPAPGSPEWTAAQEGSGAILGGAGIEASGAIPAIKNVTKAVVKPIAGVAGDVLGTAGEAIKSVKTAAKNGSFPVRPSTSTITEALSPGDLQFQKHAPTALSEIKAGSRAVSKVEDALANLDERTEINNKAVKRIVTPQEGVDATAYRKHIVQKQIEAIPVDTKPAIRQRLIKDIERRTPQKITIGWLNDMRQELGATQSPFYGKDATGQLTMDAGSRAVDIARGQAVRESFYHSLDNAPGAMGGGEAARELNSRMGASLHMKDALQHKLNSAVAERQSPMMQRLQKVRHAIGRPGQTIAHGLPETIDEQISNAIKDHPDVPTEVNHTFQPTPKSGRWNPVGGPIGPNAEVVPEQLELAPSGGGDLLNPQERSPITPGHSDMEDVFRRGRAGEAPTPEELSPGQLTLDTQVPPDLFQEKIGKVKQLRQDRLKMEVPKKEPKLDSNYQLVVETPKPAHPPAPSREEQIIEVVKKLLAQRGD